MRFHHLPKLTTLILAIFFGVAFFSSAPYSMISPAQAQATYPHLVSIKKPSISYASKGNFYLLAISITDPAIYTPGLAYLWGWIKGDWVVIPKSVIFPANKTPQEIYKSNKAEMVSSQKSAISAALNFLAKKYPKDYKNLKAEDITFDIKRTGGPSGGLVLALSIIELATEKDLLRGRQIATTGTINPAGFVGAIGGVNEKLISVARQGIPTVLIPSDNCLDISSVPDGVTVIPVSTLEEAVEVITGEKVARVCTNLRA